MHSSPGMPRKLNHSTAAHLCVPRSLVIVQEDHAIRKVIVIVEDVLQIRQGLSTTCGTRSVIWGTNGLPLFHEDHTKREGSRPIHVRTVVREHYNNVVPLTVTLKELAEMARCSGRYIEGRVGAGMKGNSGRRQVLRGRGRCPQPNWITLDSR